MSKSTKIQTILSAGAIIAAALTFTAPVAAQADPAKTPALKTVVVLSSGVMVNLVQEGDGAKPKADSKVTVHYRGTLRDGTEFDSSYRRDAPATFSLNRVIPCWTAAVQEIAVGGTATVFCPAATAYGDRGVGPFIKPNTDLFFEISLIAIE